jgi:hypothetical protein
MARPKKVRPEMETEIEAVVEAPKKAAKKTASVEIENSNSGLDNIPLFVEPEPNTKVPTSKELYDRWEASKQPDDPKEAQREALNDEVMRATGGAAIDNQVWQAKKRDGSTGGVSLKFYFNCKMNEIETGAECMYEKLVSAPVEALKPSAALALPGAAMKGAKKCSNCN